MPITDQYAQYSRVTKRPNAANIPITQILLTGPLLKNGWLTHFLRISPVLKSYLQVNYLPICLVLKSFILRYCSFVLVYFLWTYFVWVWEVNPFISSWLLKGLKLPLCPSQLTLKLSLLILAKSRTRFDILRKSQNHRQNRCQDLSG